jgi:tetratricopeptide (TPR) repeat protein
MTRSRVWAWISQLPALLLLLGMLVFALGILLQYALNRPIILSPGPDSSTFAPLAMAGLCMATLTLIIWFAGAAFLLARQTRLHGADYAQAYRMMDAFQFSEAIPLLEHSITTGKETVEVLSLLARAYAYIGQYSRAHTLLDRAVELYPDSAVPYLTLGLVFLLEGNDEQTIEAFQVAVAREPAAMNWADLGLALAFAGRQNDALNALEKASQQPLPTPHALRVYYRLTSLYAMAGNAPKAASAAAKMVSARDGLSAWEYQLSALKGTGYGQKLTHEIQAITKALREADAARVPV